MLPHPLTNFEMQKYYQNEPKFKEVYSRNNLPKIKDRAYVINLDEYKLIGTHWIALYVNGDNVTYFDSFNTSDHTKCISLNNQSGMTRQTLIDLNPDEYNQGWRYYPFMVNFDRCNVSYNSLDNPFGRICVPNKTEDVYVSVFNVITRINESKTLTKHISCGCKYKFDGRICNSNQKQNNDKCRCDCANPGEHHVCEKNYI